MNGEDRDLWAGGAPVRWLAVSVLLVSTLLLFVLIPGRPAHAADYTVTNTGDSGAGSLRDAITKANKRDGRDRIGFDILGAGPHTISPASRLPSVTEAVTIDGYTQPGASENTIRYPRDGTNAVLKIELNGQPSGAGLVVSSSNVTVRGLVVNRCLERCIFFFGGSGNKAEGNFVGTDPSGTTDMNPELGVGVGVRGGRNNLVGGSSPGARNLLSGNANGVSIFSDGAVSPAKVASGNRVQGNLIGTQKDGASPLGNALAGVALLDKSFGNIVGGGAYGGNVIAHNGGDGILISGWYFGDVPVKNQILGNFIYSNGGQGIDLGNDGRTANDPKDSDKGPNGLQNFPVINSATTTYGNDGKTTIKGTLDSTPSVKKRKNGKSRIVRRYFTVRFYFSPDGEDEGRYSEGRKTIKTNLSGDASFTFVLDPPWPTGDVVTATATGPGGTSEFSDPVIISGSP